MAKFNNPLDRFELASTSIKPRIIGAGWGEVGTGKTEFGLGMPGPLLVQSLDKGLEGVIERIIDETGKDIRVKEYDWIPTENTLQEDAQALCNEFTEDFEYAVMHFRSILWDKESDIWEMFRYAEFGAPNDDPRNYPKLNQRYRRLVNMPKAGDLNFWMTQGVKDEWDSRVNPKNGKKQGFSTGRRKRHGFSELEALIHIDLKHTRSEGKFYAEVGKSRGPGGREIQDKIYENLNFTELGMMVFPGTTEEDWQ